MEVTRSSSINYNKKWRVYFGLDKLHVLFLLFLKLQDDIKKFVFVEFNYKIAIELLRELRNSVLNTVPEQILLSIILHEY